MTIPFWEDGVYILHRYKTLAHIVMNLSEIGYISVGNNEVTVRWKSQRKYRLLHSVGDFTAFSRVREYEEGAVKRVF